MTNHYKPELVKFMPYKDNVSYRKDRTFTVDELLRITPEDLCGWMNEQTYGDPEPSDDMRTMHRRSTILEFTKKATSSFMPRINLTWGPVTERGNPTRSDVVNKLIKGVKNFKVRREGSEFKARWPVELTNS
ncbi:hypothetical protein F443_13181 [Phytophthora nicotianae P1569]|uniref:Uncharacterized protein n=1 Tax=Phytophthora nicotianae P1569 TaxID=1317065 RepID=V9EQR2_PHYNI|nr:hypothetical protein F443_13181 [Phytophthora nicotianae P1569]